MDIAQLTGGDDLAAVLAGADRAGIEALVDRAARPDVPLAVFLAVLDRYDDLARQPPPEEAEGDVLPVGAARGES
jgi:hypothetical protein